MSIQQQVLDILACPETKEPVALADAALIATLNAAIEAGALHNREGATITEALDDGLIRADHKYLYPIRNDIPMMLIDEGIPLDQL